MKQRKILTLCLAGMSVSLLAVGGVSGTLVRHVVQIVPAIGALAAVWRHRAWGSDAALPVFGVWLLLMSFIWLYLLGIQTFFDGTFSATEVVLTLVIGVLAVRGVISCISSGEKPGLARRALTLVTFTVFQVGAMWVSFLPWFANR